MSPAIRVLTGLIAVGAVIAVVMVLLRAPAEDPIRTVVVLVLPTVAALCGVVAVRGKVQIVREESTDDDVP